jgi:hypothetical protein
VLRMDDMNWMCHQLAVPSKAVCVLCATDCSTATWLPTPFQPCMHVFQGHVFRYCSCRRRRMHPEIT